MPFPDRPEFQAWLARHHDHYANEKPATPPACKKCGDAVDLDVSAHECVPCLAEQFGIATIERWVADVVAGVIAAADNPQAFAQLFGEILRFSRDIVVYHAQPDAR
jgi:hypothetical protein